MSSELLNRTASPDVRAQLVASWRYLREAESLLPRDHRPTQKRARPSHRRSNIFPLLCSGIVKDQGTGPGPWGTTSQPAKPPRSPSLGSKLAAQNLATFSTLGDRGFDGCMPPCGSSRLAKSRGTMPVYPPLASALPCRGRSSAATSAPAACPARISHTGGCDSFAAMSVTFSPPVRLAPAL